MRASRIAFAFGAAAVFALVAAAAGCDSTSGGSSTFDVGGDGSHGGASFANDASSAFVPDGSSLGNCDGLRCQQVQCASGTTTTVTGKVYDPAGKNPLYNAIVYVPNAPLEPIKQGVSCDRCGELTSGTPIAVALTDADGTFTLKNVPAGTDIPLVVQMGRWRRKVTLPNVTACESTPLTDPNLTRLPRNKAEGDIPKMAIASGSADPFECLLKKIGIEDAEFTQGNSAGRVNYYVSNGNDMNPPAPSAGTLWSNPNMLRQYDIVMLPCEGGANLKGAQTTQNILDYTAAGGRIFSTHYGYVWIFDAQSPWPQTGTWHPEQDRSDTDALVTNIDTTFPKGKAFADWLFNVGASTSVGHGRLAIKEWRHDLDNVDFARARKWISSNTVFGPNTFPNSVQHMTFNTPVDAPVDDAGAPQQCGRVVYSDFHVSAADNVAVGKPFFPQSCNDSPMSDQEKALEFMFFDLASCVQKDDDPPLAPPIR